MPFSKMEKKTEPVIFFFFFYQSGSVQPCRQVEGTSKYSLKLSFEAMLLSRYRPERNWA